MYNRNYLPAISRISKKFHKFVYGNKESFDAKNKEGYFYLAVRFAADA